jgi:hypothetical protein
MKTLTPILIVAASALAVASVQYARRASAERQRADAEVALRQKQNVRIRELERAQASLERQLIEAQRPVVPTADSAAAATAPRGPFGPSAAAFEVRPVSGAAAMNAPRPGMFRGPGMMASPAAQKFMRTQIRGNLRRMYEDVGRELNLSADQTSKLVDLVTDQQTRGFGQHREFPTDRAALQQMAKDISQNNDAEVAGLIGEDKLPQWESYQKTLPERSQLDQVRQQLESAGVPLTQDQRGEMLTAMLEEKQRLPRPSPVPGATPEETMAQQNEWQEEYDRSVQERARQVLTQEQYERYHDYQEWMSDMRKSVGRGMRFGGAVGSVSATAVLESSDSPPPSGPPPRP